MILPQTRTARVSRACNVRLIDFGSALDAHSVSSLYGEQGPSAEEQTMEYAPPEALLGRSVACLPATLPATGATHSVIHVQHTERGWQWSRMTSTASTQ